jgi:ADP-ribose pyrophosphatase
MATTNIPEDDTVIKPWKDLSYTMALDERWFPVKKHVVELPSGKILDDYFVWQSPTISVAVPITEDGKFVVCQQYRFGVDKIMYQFPAGMVNKNEDPETAARRELEEESGYVGGELTYLGKVSPFGPKMIGWHHIFLIKNVNPGGHKDDDENEPTKVYLKTASELEAMIENGEFESADCLAGAFWALRKLGL